MSGHLGDRSTGRIHGRTVTATARAEGALVELVSPAPGLFHSSLRPGDLVRPGQRLGILEVLGQSLELHAPDGGPVRAAGVVTVVVEPGLARVPVDHGRVLLTLDPSASAGLAGTTTDAASTDAMGGLVFRAPTSGRFYGRPSPDKPAFVQIGDELTAGATICLLEIMKTFHRVTFGGPGLPERARVTALLVADGADVTSGDPLLALE